MATAARTTIPLNDALIWQTRCRILAAQHQLTATRHGRNKLGIHLYSVPSTSHPGSVHYVRYHSLKRQVECNCPAARHGLACGHAGAVLLAIDRAEQAAAAQSDAWRWWMSGGEW